jgi:iron complex transport system permease protein
MIKGRWLGVGLGVAVGVLVLAVALGLAVGSRGLPLSEVLGVLGRRDGSDASIIVWEQRLPRTLLGVLVGAALGIGGALAQGITRNPLADPALLGVSAGAALAIVVGSFAFGITGLAPQIAAATDRRGRSGRRGAGAGRVRDGSGAVGFGGAIPGIEPKWIHR